MEARSKQSLARGMGCVTLAALLATTGARAATIVDDKFIDGGVTDGSDASDVGWYPVVNAAGGTNPSPQSDSTTGPNEGGNDAALQFTPSAAFAGTGASFTQVTLAVGQTITLSFDARFTGTPTTNGGGFRLGLYNTDGGTTGTSNSNSDYGYLVRAPAGGTAAAPSLAKELGNGTNGGGAAGNGALILGGNDILTVGTYANSVAALGAASATYSLAITRTSATAVSFGLQVNGVSVGGGPFTDSGNVPGATGSPANTPAYFTFNEIVIGTGNVTSNPTFRVDNVLLTVTTAVPEPAAMGLMALGGLSLLCRRTRRC